LADDLGLAAQDVAEENLAVQLAGNALPEGAAPIAQAYAGHQFGHFTILGDGRAIVLGEHISPDRRRYDIQLKGSGVTPYSRRGDGRAALAPMLREYVISEALHALGIPTTRSLAVIATNEPVYREKALPGAVLTRVASSHLRVGTFQYVAARGDIDALRALVAYAINRHFPQFKDAETPALALLEAVIEKQAALIAEWMRVGFIHGVMNTDNVTISGETIDYGPCAFMDAYDPATVFSSIDHGGRYAFGNQPLVAQWNLARFAETLLPLLHSDQDKAIKLAEARILGFQEIYSARWRQMTRKKLGLLGEQPEDETLIDGLLTWMHENRADYTNTFHHLGAGLGSNVYEGIYADPIFKDWHTRWQLRSAQVGVPETPHRIMRVANPVYIPRNHKVEEALNAASQDGNLEPLQQLLDVLAAPYTERQGREIYTESNPNAQGYQTYCGT
jgi:uncharacterized protein YdiU (UPF0061 family)